MRVRVLHHDHSLKSLCWFLVAEQLRHTWFRSILTWDNMIGTLISSSTTSSTSSPRWVRWLILCWDAYIHTNKYELRYVVLLMIAVINCPELKSLREREIMREIEEHVMFEREIEIDRSLFDEFDDGDDASWDRQSLSHSKSCSNKRDSHSLSCHWMPLDWFLVVVVAHDNHRMTMKRSLMMIEEEQALADLEHQLVGKPHHRALGQVSNHEHHQHSSLEGAILVDASHVHKSMV